MKRAYHVCLSTQWNTDDSHLSINGARRAEAAQIEVLKKSREHFRSDVFAGSRRRLVAGENVWVRGGRGRFERNSLSVSSGILGGFPEGILKETLTPPKQFRQE